MSRMQTRYSIRLMKKLRSQMPELSDTQRINRRMSWFLGKEKQEKCEKEAKKRRYSEAEKLNYYASQIQKEIAD